ncbi:binary toxin-like calcium binding domain-containing protein [Bacillus thuringiensis]|uniref:binary toxin-like calcium binding domain-containing protein n=1 Tax=Bacillus thuringiensis TaxID=1428 RepID=UPI0023E8F37C|nr:binary toxin-like calcium binding domain-containing protein [Bacillus thuringiensis]
MGYIKSDETGDFTFKLSDDEHAIIEVDGKIVSMGKQEKQIIHLEKDKLVRIKIEYRPANQLQLDNKIFQDLKLYKVDDQNKAVPMQQDDLRNPDFNSEETRSFITKASKTNLFNGKVRSDDDDHDHDLDTDGDGIPDIWEVNGYTIQKKLAVKWDGFVCEPRIY